MGGRVDGWTDGQTSTKQDTLFLNIPDKPRLFFQVRTRCLLNAGPLRGQEGLSSCPRPDKGHHTHLSCLCLPSHFWLKFQ